MLKTPQIRHDDAANAIRFVIDNIRLDKQRHSDFPDYGNWSVLGLSLISARTMHGKVSFKAEDADRFHAVGRITSELLTWIAAVRNGYENNGYQDEDHVWYNIVIKDNPQPFTLYGYSGNKLEDAQYDFETLMEKVRGLVEHWDGLLNSGIGAANHE